MLFLLISGLYWSRGQTPEKSLGSVGGRSVNQKDAQSNKGKFRNGIHDALNRAGVCVYFSEKVSTLGKASVLPLRNVQCVRVEDVPVYFMQTLFIVVLQ